MSYKEFKDNYDFLCKEWRNDAGQFHREDGPAEIKCHHDGETLLEAFWINGKRHRELGPAQIRYYIDGSIEREYFYVFGKSHRELGPAQIHYNPDGSIEWEQFYIEGRPLGFDKEGFWALWHKLTHEQQQNHNLLKYLVRYS
jgi:hypothetical protein